MRFVVSPSKLAGEVAIPGSKSHTIRALLLGALAEGESAIEAPLESADTRACVDVCRGLGAEITEGEPWRVRGFGGPPAPPENVLDVANSGTTLYLALGIAALGAGYTVFTGDDQIRRRTGAPLIDALGQLGAEARSTRDNGCAPFIVRGPLIGGEATLEARSSQYVSGLLLSCPLAEGDSRIRLSLLNEAPYIEITLAWLRRCGLRVDASTDLMEYRVPGGQRVAPFSARVPADFSSATFFLCAAAATGCELTLVGLDMADSQGDKAVVDYLRAMGATVEVDGPRMTVRGGALHGADLDLNATPDALPAMAVVGCLAEGTTRLLNVPQARIKETDRIATVREELTRMGARIEELPDGLVIEGGGLRGAEVDGRHDHRLVMALAVAGLAAEGETRIATAEAAGVTFPTFAALMRSVGASVAEE
jgi:3-phosphoshikimate 1-carboxyvinyltransferase